MTDAREMLSPELISQIEEAARREDRRPSEVLEDAWHRYVDEKSWSALLEHSQRNAAGLGLAESDVERLIAEYRAEKRAH